MDSLLYKTDALDEEVSIYGVEDTSKYISLPDAKNLKEKDVYISKPFSDKYDVAVGDTVTLNAKYEKKKYLFKSTFKNSNFVKCSNLHNKDKYQNHFSVNSPYYI